MRTCYVALPAGMRPDPDGRMLDFEHLYSAILKPVIEDAGLECRRLEEFAPGTSWQRSLFTAILSSDLMIADISSQNPNVMYELGIRHALKRGRTLMISAGSRPPSNVGQVQALFYRPDADGRLTGAAADEFRRSLQSVVQISQRSTISDSPLYEYFPEIEVYLPSEIEAQTAWRMRARGRSRTGSLGGSNRRPGSSEAIVSETRQLEAEARSAGADPMEILGYLRRYRDASAWDDLIRLADEAPPSVAQSSEVRQLLALALNRRGRSGDQDRAIALMEQLVAQTGGDAETFGVLGRIYKDRYEVAHASGDATAAMANLDRALQHYRAGFETTPNDVYSGLNVVTLLQQRGDAASQAELATILPRVRAAARERVESGWPDIWDLATLMQLAFVAGDWDEAERIARVALAREGGRLMLDPLRRELRDLSTRLTDPTQRARAIQLDALLAGDPNTGASNA